MQINLWSEYYFLMRIDGTVQIIISFMKNWRNCYHMYRKNIIDVNGFWKTDRNITIRLIQLFGPAIYYIATLIHYPFTVTLSCTVSWLVCFSRGSFSNHVKSQLRQWDPCRYYMKGMGLKLTPVVMRRVLGPLGRFRTMADIFGFIASPNSPNSKYNPPTAAHPTPHTCPLLYTCHSC